MTEKHCRECGAALIKKELMGEGIVPFCPKCGEFRFPMYNVAVSMIVVNRQTNQILLIKQRWFAKMQFRQLRLKAELFDDYYRDTAAIQKNDMIAFLKASTSYRLKDSIKKSKADIHIYFGEKENRIIKRSAAMLRETVNVCSLTELPGMFHGDFSINHPLDYVNEINKIVYQ